MSRIEALIQQRKNSLARGVLNLGSDVAITDAELRELLAHPGVPALNQIHVFDGKLGIDGARALIESEKVRGVDDLYVGSCPIGDDGLALLAGALSAVTKLSAPNVGATARGAAAVAGGSWRLVSLELGHQALGDAGANALAALTLDNLMVQAASIGGDGARALIAARGGQLKLEDNPIGGGLAGLATIGRTTLLLGKAKLGDADVEALAAAAAPALRTLSLPYNAIGDAGLTALARGPWLAQLEALDVTGAPNGAGLSALQAAWTGRPGLTPSA